mmetsp:Transcript_75621/g.209314  ORF Transcript_75621/g.209314 Transcript_75621/m.209314 type:complete len:223 (-) Transcript_75621:8-676(-)
MLAKAKSEALCHTAPPLEAATPLDDRPRDVPHPEAMAKSPAWGRTLAAQHAETTRTPVWPRLSACTAQGGRHRCSERRPGPPPAQPPPRSAAAPASPSPSSASPPLSASSWPPAVARSGRGSLWRCTRPASSSAGSRPARPRPRSSPPAWRALPSSPGAASWPLPACACAAPPQPLRQRRPLPRAFARPPPVPRASLWAFAWPAPANASPPPPAAPPTGEGP